MGQLDRGVPSAGVAPCDYYTSSQTGSVFNNRLANFEVQIPANATTTGFPANIIVRWEAGSGCTIAGTRLIYMYYASETATIDLDSSFIRMEDNSDAGYGPYAFLELAHGNASTKGPKFLIHSNAALGLCHHNTAALSLVQSGWFRVAFGSTARYIALYSS